MTSPVSSPQLLSTVSIAERQLHVSSARSTMGKLKWKDENRNLTFTYRCKYQEEFVEQSTVAIAEDTTTRLFGSKQSKYGFSSSSHWVAYFQHKEARTPA